MKWYYLPFLFQGLMMGIDEVIHSKRILPRWERIGHPLDTLTVFASYLFLVFFDYSAERMKFYIGLCIFSSLFVTKDEFLHAKECTPLEHWLHAMLFLLHPLSFIAAGIVWRDHPEDSFLILLPVLTGLYTFYQMMRWNFLWQIPRK